MGPHSRAPAPGDPPGETLPRRHRLRRRSEIKRVQDHGQRFTASALVLMIQPNPDGVRRLGVTVSSKVGNSVVRSKVKRRLRAIFRHRRSLLPPGCDAVLVARGQAAGASFAELARQFEAVADKARRRLGSKPEGPKGGEADGASA